MSSIEHRFDFIFLFDVTSGNPNGDPDAGNAPRIDPETGHGYVSDVCLKRKVRNYIMLAKNGVNGSAPAPGYDIYVKERSILELSHKRAYEVPAIRDTKEGGERVDLARKWMCQTYFDVRMFGAVMSLKEANCGQVRGPVQFAFARSKEPISLLEQSITRMAVATKREADEQSKRQEGQARTMGRKTIIPYALYVAHGFISPYLAADTGFSEEDLNLLWQALKMMFEHDRSAARGEMSSRKLVVFEHESMLGNAPAHALFDRVKIKRIDESRPAREYTDYEVTVEKTDPPTGITVHEML